MRFKGKVTLVTGGSHGIGRGISEMFAREGAKVIVNYSREADSGPYSGSADQLVSALRADGGEAIAYSADVSKSGEVKEMVLFTRKQYGRIDILVNNAGICPFVDFLDMSEGVWDHIFAVNLKGTYLCSQAVGRVMVEQEIKGRIICISSIGAIAGTTFQSHYCSTKAGVESQTIARRVGTSRPTVQLWRERFLALRTAGLEKDAPRPGRIPPINDSKRAAIVEATLHSQPRHATHWSTRSMAKAQGVSEATVRRIWKQHGLRPHRISTFKVSRDPRFVEKLTEVVGLYLNPPDKALVLCLDEKSQIQALDRTQPGLPMKPGRCGTMTHDYKRHGTTTPFAALSTLDGAVIEDCMAQHRHQEFIRFLKRIDHATPREIDLHLIVDNYATHKHPEVERGLGRHPRFHLHFTPTSCSWLNLVECWFRNLTQQRLRRGSVPGCPTQLPRGSPRPTGKQSELRSTFQRRGSCA